MNSKKSLLQSLLLAVALTFGVMEAFVSSRTKNEGRDKEISGYSIHVLERIITNWRLLMRYNSLVHCCFVLSMCQLAAILTKLAETVDTILQPHIFVYFQMLDIIKHTSFVVKTVLRKQTNILLAATAAVQLFGKPSAHAALARMACLRVCLASS